MKLPDRQQYMRVLLSLRASLIMLAFGIAVLAFLTVIERPHWFELRPASGTASAMWHAGTKGEPQQPAPSQP